MSNKKIKESYVDGTTDDDSEKLFTVIKLGEEIREAHNTFSAIAEQVNIGYETLQVDYQSRKSLLRELNDGYTYWKPLIGETHPLCVKIAGIIRKLKSI